MLLRLDLFPKSDRSYRSRGTTSGGYATLISYLIAAALLRYEALTWYDHRNRSYPPPSPSSPSSSPSPLSLPFSPFTETVVVHRRLDRRLGATVNVTFPNVYSCGSIVADYIDIGGDEFPLSELPGTFSSGPARGETVAVPSSAASEYASTK